MFSKSLKCDYAVYIITSCHDSNSLYLCAWFVSLVRLFELHSVQRKVNKLYYQKSLIQHELQLHSDVFNVAFLACLVTFSGVRMSLELGAQISSCAAVQRARTSVELCIVFKWICFSRVGLEASAFFFFFFFWWGGISFTTFLVQLLSAQIAGCSLCIDTHTHTLYLQFYSKQYNRIVAISIHGATYLFHISHQVKLAASVCVLLWPLQLSSQHSIESIVRIIMTALFGGVAFTRMEYVCSASNDKNLSRFHILFHSTYIILIHWWW